MADLTFPSWGHHRMQGDPPHKRLGVVLNSPVHHWALMRRPLHDQAVSDQLAELGLDAAGAPLSIVTVARG